MKVKRKTLEKAAKVVQECCDYIEVNGFDITDYGSEGGPCCIIGTPRAVVGLNPEPEGATDEGDGQELTIVLEALDRAGEKSSLIASAKEALSMQEDRSEEPGRLMEAVGFAYKRDGKTMEEQKYIALAFFRKANTEIQEALGNV